MACYNYFYDYNKANIASTHNKAVSFNLSYAAAAASDTGTSKEI